MKIIKLFVNRFYPIFNLVKHKYPLNYSFDVNAALIYSHVQNRPRFTFFSHYYHSVVIQ